MLINSPNISGSLKVTGNTVITGSLTVLGGINATITGSATTASYVEYNNIANKPTLVSGSEQVSFNGIIDKPTLVSGSEQITYSGLSGIPSGILSSSTQITGYNVFATTGSNQFNGSQAITGSLTVTGQVVAQTLNVQQVTSSIVFSSGSNIFGNSLSNTQQFTGSVSVTGSLTVNGAGAFASSVNATKVSINSTSTSFTPLFLNSEGNYSTSGNMTNGFAVSNGIFGRALNMGVFESGAYAWIQAAYINNADTTFPLLLQPRGGNVGIGVTDLGPNGLSLPTGFNYSWSEGSGNAYAVLFRQRNSAATVVASGYKRSDTGGFASSFGTSMSRAAIAVGYNNGSIAFFSDSATNVANGTDIAPTERLTITNTGNVGIGTDNPSSRLHVSGSSQVISYFQTSGTYAPISWTGDNGTTKGGVIAHDGYISIGPLNVSGTGVNSSQAINITNSGNVGIGTNSPGVKLVNSGATLASLPTLGSGTIGANAILSANGLYGLYTGVASEGWVWQQVQRNDSNNTVYSLILQPLGGNVGIGTTDPSAILHTTGVSSSSGSSGIVERIRNNYYIGFTSRVISSDTNVFKVSGFTPVDSSGGAAVVRVVISGTKVGVDTFASIYEFTILRNGQSALSVTEQRNIGRGGLSASVSGNEVIFALLFASYSDAIINVELMCINGAPNFEQTVSLSFL
jgi:hypothetical protein